MKRKITTALDLNHVKNDKIRINETTRIKDADDRDLVEASKRPLQGIYSREMRKKKSSFVFLLLKYKVHPRQK